MGVAFLVLLDAPRGPVVGNSCLTAVTA